MTEPVSRETPSTPEAARRVFASGRLALAERYAELLATDGVTRGLIGPREAPRLWERHLINCALLADLIPPGASVCDVGSGAGLPGVVLAIARPDLEVTLVEPLLRRTTFLTEVVAGLGLERAEVVRGRAEDLHGQRTFAVVTSRAVAPLERLLGWSMPLVAPTGVLLAMKGAAVTDEIAAAQSTLRRWGCAPPRIRTLGAGGEQEGAAASPAMETGAVVLEVAWADPGRVSWPTGRAPTGGTPQRRAARKRGRAHRRGGE